MRVRVRMRGLATAAAAVAAAAAAAAAGAGGGGGRTLNELCAGTYMPCWMVMVAYCTIEGLVYSPLAAYYTSS